MEIKSDTISSLKIYLPKPQSQKKIVSFFLLLSNNINNEQQTVDKLKKIKTSMLKLMFPQDKVSYPRLRFNDYADAWEQRYIFSKPISKNQKKNTQQLLTAIRTTTNITPNATNIFLFSIFFIIKDIIPFIATTIIYFNHSSYCTD